MRPLTAYLIGVVFGLGIVVSGMANPAKVLNFFDIFGDWDPSLAFVMGGAVAVAFFGYRLVFSRSQPLAGDSFALPRATRIDARLIVGSGIFGIGWGIAGFCPGGALPALGTGRPEVAIFVLAVIAGLLATRFTLKVFSTPSGTPSSRPA